MGNRFELCTGRLLFEDDVIPSIEIKMIILMLHDVFVVSSLTACLFCACLAYVSLDGWDRYGSVKTVDTSHFVCAAWGYTLWESASPDARLRMDRYENEFNKYV